MENMDPKTEQALRDRLTCLSMEIGEWGEAMEINQSLKDRLILWAREVTLMITLNDLTNELVDLHGGSKESVAETVAAYAVQLDYQPDATKVTSEDADHLRNAFAAALDL